jgi:hypothetical protein
MSFPLFCYTAGRNCPTPDTNIRLPELIGSPRDITRLENELGAELRRELDRLGRRAHPPLRRLHKRPSIECRILTFQ